MAKKIQKVEASDAERRLVQRASRAAEGDETFVSREAGGVSSNPRQEGGRVLW